jgi:hypothetical protein
MTEAEETYGRCSLCAKDIGHPIGALMQHCRPCTEFGFVGAGGTLFPPIPNTEWFGRRMRPTWGKR